MDSNQENLSATRSVLLGMIGFTLVSLGGFSIWAFGGNWFYKHFGEGGLYAVCALIFIVLAGVFLHPLIVGEKKVIRLYRSFVPAFFAYAIAWSLCWFLLKFGAGEWLGSLVGCAAFAFVLGKSFKSASGFSKVTAILFLAHSAGYFLGETIYMSSRTPPEFLSMISKFQFSILKKMAWGLFYGLGFGAGMGYAFHAFQAGLTGKMEKEREKAGDVPLP